MGDSIRTTTVTIANGASLSGAVNLTELGQLVGLVPDAAWDTNAISFQASVDGTNFFNLSFEGTEISIAAAAASVLQAVDAVKFLACRYLKVRSGTSAAAVNQAGDSVVTLILRRGLA